MITLREAVQIIQNGGVILYPTDTIWGIGCDPRNTTAVERIFTIKRRNPTKSMILLASNMRQVEQIVPDFPDVCYDLVEFSESPLTIVYPSSQGICSQVCGQDNSVAIRVSKDPFCKQLIDQLKFPLVSTSANISGEHFPLSLSDIPPEIIQAVDGVLENPQFVGTQLPSKIIKIGKNNQIELIRK
jgi:L-threonylcarbamoyladenylate synthase